MFNNTKLFVAGGIRVQSSKRQSSSISNTLSTRTSVLPSHDAYLGEVDVDSTDVKWTKLGGMKKGRYKHMAFKMNESIYICGGLVVGKTVLSSCERYSIPEDKWFGSVHKLPQPLYDASVVVTPDEQFAILIGGNDQNKKPTNNILIYDEANGFKVLDQKLSRPRSKNISICL